MATFICGLKEGGGESGVKQFFFCFDGVLVLTEWESNVGTASTQARQKVGGVGQTTQSALC